MKPLNLYKMNEDSLSQIKIKLKREYYLMNDEWLKDCTEFYVNQHKNPSIGEILQFVKVQWQLSNLREINNENGCLPPNIQQQKCIILSENYILQVEQMYDISVSKYKQLEQIRNTNISEVEPSETEKIHKWEPPKKRMIQLRLTDGVQDIIGIEYNYISWFNDMLLPGYKVMIIGPVKCHTGVLLLEEGKIKGIGGEVDSLLVPNALENVLARALNLEENPDPYNDNESKPNIKSEDPKIDDNFFEEEFEINLEEVSEIEELHNKNDKQSKFSKTEDLYNKNHKHSNSEIKTEIRSENISNTSTTFTDAQNCEEAEILDDDDCFLEMVDEGKLLELQLKQVNAVTAPFKTLPKEENDDIIIINQEQMITDESVPPKLEKYKYVLENKKQISRLGYEWFDCKKDSSATTLYSVASQKQGETSKIGGKRPISTPFSETKTLKKGKIEKAITEMIESSNCSDTPKICDFIHDIKSKSITSTTFKTIRGHVEILGKLAKKDSMWILECTIGDGTGTIEVSFSNKVLEELLGFNVQEFSVKKKLKKNPEIEHQLRMSFRSAEHKIKTLDALLELELNVDRKPTVIKIIDLNQEQKEIIDKRLKFFLTQM